MLQTLSNQTCPSRALCTRLGPLHSQNKIVITPAVQLLNRLVSMLPERTGKLNPISASTNAQQQSGLRMQQAFRVSTRSCRCMGTCIAKYTASISESPVSDTATADARCLSWLFRLRGSQKGWQSSGRPIDKVDKGKAAILARLSVIGNVDARNGTKWTEQLLPGTKANNMRMPCCQGIGLLTITTQPMQAQLGREALLSFAAASSCQATAERACAG